MEPKLKAKELIDKFYLIVRDEFDTEKDTIRKAKECAEIAVEYMDEACGSALAAMGLPTEHIEAITIEYLNDLLKEIENYEI